jgi:hypothetical protein
MMPVITDSIDDHCTVESCQCGQKSRCPSPRHWHAAAGPPGPRALAPVSRRHGDNVTVIDRDA